MPPAASASDANEHGTVYPILGIAQGWDATNFAIPAKAIEIY